MKNETSSTRTCRICGSSAGERPFLCRKCGFNRKAPLLNLGDLPNLLVVISLIFLFLIEGGSNTEAFSVQGFNSNMNTFVIFLEISILAVIIWNLVIDRRIILKWRMLRPLLFSFVPLFAALPVVLLSTTGPDMIFISVSVVVFPILILSIAVTNRGKKRKDIIWLFITFTLVLLFGHSLGMSLRGYTGFLGLSYITNPVMVSASLLAIFISYMKYFQNLSILGKQFIHIWTLVVTAITFLLVLNIDIEENEVLMGLAWGGTLLVLLVHLSSCFTRNSMDLAIYRYLKDIDQHRRKIEGFQEKNETTYQLHHLDLMINENPIHGFNDIRKNGNLIFELEGEKSDIDIEGEFDEMVNAHCQKAKLLASRGKFPEAVKEYNSAIVKGPDSYRTYYDRSMIQSILPGKEKEVEKDLDIFLRSRMSSIDELIDRGISDKYIYLFSYMYSIYADAIDRKRRILKKMGRSGGDIWSYYTLVRD